MPQVKINPHPFLLGLIGFILGYTLGDYGKQTESSDTNKEPQLGNHQWVMALPSSWVSSEKLSKGSEVPSLKFAKMEEQKPVCVENVSALKWLGRAGKSHVISIEAYITEQHKPMLLRILSGESKSYKFFPASEVSHLSICLDEPRIKYGVMK